MHIKSDRHETLRIVCCFVAAALIAASGSVFANDYSVDRVKATLSEIGTGKDARVTVKLKSGTVLKGYIAEVSKEDFSIVSKAETQKVLYSEAAKVKKRKLNVGIKIAIVAGVVIGVLVGLMYMRNADRAAAIRRSCQLPREAPPLELLPDGMLYPAF